MTDQTTAPEISAEEADKRALGELSVQELVKAVTDRYAEYNRLRREAEAADLLVSRGQMTPEELAAAKDAVNAASSAWYRAHCLGKAAIRSELTALGYDVEAVGSLLR